MADKKISELTLGTPTPNNPMVYVSDPTGTPITKRALLSMFVPLAAGITSTSWDGDAHSTTAKTLIDLSAVFSGVPAEVSAVLVRASCNDSASAGTPNLYLILSPNNTAGSGPFISRVSGLPNDYAQDALSIVPCDAGGDIYYQIAASGASTFDVRLEIWGWWI